MKNRNQITKASSRFVFIDEGRPSVDSYAVYYGTSSGYAEKWFDPPPVRHENGTSVSFADGHSAFHKWKSQETITIGNGSVYSVAPSTCDAKNDLYWVQIGCWGQLGYTPSCPVNLE
jgi:prepilin-type processing-associated H-X9-DG protein